MNDLAVVVLAAGKGVRMRSDLPKVFHRVLGEPMLSHVLKSVQELGPAKILVVVGYQREMIMSHYRDWPVKFVIQAEQKGTGHAVLQAAPFLDDFSGTVLVVAGDVPLLSTETMRRLLAFHRKNGAVATDLTAELPDGGNYGRIVRQVGGELLKIVEKKDATPEELRIREVNTGTFCFDKEALFAALAEVGSENAQKEYYLTDTIEILRRQGKSVFAFSTNDPAETLGVNTREELAEIEKLLRLRRERLADATAK
ncbi:MAG: NTP transferase domain-containing protein [Candidatus Margulisbacteria bacterium]|nr:NTP transferase domain-containing protein [Candidatus Margulisiibacteriota bacterium]MBU1617251.1 NTP transferase domain-containing protein [Candidatus Margulisiibacteriota bacterium]MBU1867633.1 NTP transferase domain-containing protein [Candidatus Margulisiibacteriota bacterium]